MWESARATAGRATQASLIQPSQQRSNEAMPRSTPVPYTPAAGDVVIHNPLAIDEFFGFAGDCGQAAAEILYAWAHGQAPSGAHINAVVVGMQQAHLAGPQGVSSLQGNSRTLANEGVPNQVTSDWLTALQQAGRVPIEIGVGNAQALPGDQLGVQG